MKKYANVGIMGREPTAGLPRRGWQCEDGISDLRPLTALMKISPRAWTLCRLNREGKFKIQNSKFKIISALLPACRPEDIIHSTTTTTL